MPNSLLLNLRQASLDQHMDRLPYSGTIIACTTAGALLYIATAILVVPAGEPLHKHFVSEDGLITILSAFLLIAASVFAAANFIVLTRVAANFRYLWLILALGLGFLGIDELLQIHERFGHVVGNLVGTGVFRNGNDILVILYGIVGLVIMGALLPGLLRWRQVFLLFGIAFAFYTLHTVVDAISEPPTELSVIVEESAKVLCGSFLLTGCLIGFMGTLWKFMKP